MEQCDTALPSTADGLELRIDTERLAGLLFVHPAVVTEGAAHFIGLLKVTLGRRLTRNEYRTEREEFCRGSVVSGKQTKRVSGTCQ